MIEMKTEKPYVLKHIFKKAFIAMIVADLAESVAVIIDGMLVGRFLGENSIAAFGIAKPFYSITGVLSAVLSAGALTVVSHWMGRGDKDKAGQLFSIACIWGIILSVTLAVAGFLLVDPVSRLFGASDVLLPETRRYLMGLFPGIPAIVMGNVLTVFLQLEGKYVNANLAVFITVVVNLIGDLVTIFLVHGDLLGIGLATSLSYYAALAVLLFCLLHKKTMFRLSFSGINWSQSKELFQKGLPKATRRVCNIIRPILINHLIMGIGGRLAMSAFSIQGNVADAFELPGTCLGDVVVLLCGIFYGEENEEEIKQTLTISFRHILISVNLLAAFCFFGAPLIATFYFGDRTEVVEAATLCLRFYAFRLPFLAFNEVYMNYFQAIGDSKRSHILSILQRMAYIVVSAFVLGSLFGIVGVWLAFPVGELLVSLTIVVMAAVHEKHIPRKVSDLLFLPSDFGSNLKFSFRRQLKTEEDVIKASRDMRKACGEYGVEERKSYYLSLCVEELGMNVVRHGFDKKRQSAEVRVMLVKDELTLHFRDNARKFDLTTWYNMFHSDDPVAHIGIKILMTISKEVTYMNSLDANNVLVRL